MESMFAVAEGADTPLPLGGTNRCKIHKGLIGGGGAGETEGYQTRNFGAIEENDGPHRRDEETRGGVDALH